MMKVDYYPGCTLKNTASELERTAIAALARLGVELVELPRWTCCGVTHNLADDDLMGQLSPVRNLIRAQEQGGQRLLTICSMCYNTLARSNRLVKEDPEKLATINRFMDEEPDYECEVEVVQLLDFLGQEIGWEAIAQKVRQPLSGRKIAPYYGCKLQRPRQVAIEPPGSFRLLSGLVEALGATVVDFAAKDLCCGSYQVVAQPDLAQELSGRVLTEAARAGAEMLAVSCPLCHYNLSRARADQKGAGQKQSLPEIVYFTQPLAWALGEEESEAADGLIKGTRLDREPSAGATQG